MGTVGIDELFDREFARLVRALAVAFDTESAADAVQEAFIAADRRWRHVSRYDDPAAWIRRVAVNRLRNGRRDRSRRAEILAALRPVAADDLTDDLLDLRRAVDALPERMRLCVCLHHIGGYPIAETAALLGVAEGTVKSNLHDARVRLRERLEDRHG
jgi:RNA polymerase sigma-70 factor (ECF subfamily)